MSESDKSYRQSRFELLASQNRLEAGASQVCTVTEGGIQWTVFTPTNLSKYSGGPIAVPSDCDAYSMIEKKWGNIGKHPCMPTVLEKYREALGSSTTL